MATVFKSQSRTALSLFMLSGVIMFIFLFATIFVGASELGVRLWSFVGMSAFSALGASLIHRIAVPFHCVLEIDQAELRVGKSTSNRRQITTRDEVICLIADDFEREICIDTGRWRAPILAPEVLEAGTNFEDFLDAIAEYWPNVTVLRREEYQQRIQKIDGVFYKVSAKSRKGHPRG